MGQGIPTISKSLLNNVDLAELLPGAGSDTANAAVPTPPARFSLFPGCEVVRTKKHQMGSIVDWVQAFVVYTAAIVAVKPAATLELLAYMLTVIKASQQYDGLYWRLYDTNYRINAAASGNKAWSRLDTDLYTRFFTGRAKPAVVCMVCDSQSQSTPSFTITHLLTVHPPPITLSLLSALHCVVNTWCSYIIIGIMPATLQAHVLVSIMRYCRYLHTWRLPCMNGHSLQPS